MAAPVPLSFTTLPSGTMIGLQAGAAILGFAALSEFQTLSFSGPPPQSQSFTLAYSRGTTGPVAFRRFPPSTSYSFNVAVPPGTYDVQVCTPNVAGTPPINTYTCYDGVVPVGSPFSFALGSPIAAIAGQSAPYSVQISGTTANFRPIGRFAFATGSAVVEVTAALGSSLVFSAVRLVPVDGGTPIVWGCDNAANTATAADRQYGRPPVQTNLAGIYGDGYMELTATVNGSRTAITPSIWYAAAADVGSAIAGVAGMAGSVAASSSFAIGPPGYGGSPTSPPPATIALDFSGGPLANTAIGAPTPSDPCVVAAVAHPGGQPIRFTDRAGNVTPLDPGRCTISFLSGAAPQNFFAFPWPGGAVPPGLVVDAPPGALATAGGASTGLVASPVAAYQIPVGPAPTMPYGWNPQPEDPFGAVPLYSNLAQRFPATGQGTGNWLTYRCTDAAGTPFASCPNDPDLAWTLQWSGTLPPAVVVPLAAGGTIRPPLQMTGSNSATVTGIHDPGAPSPQVGLTMPAGTSIVGLWPPGLGPTGPLLSPDTLRFLAKGGNVRTLLWTGAAASNNVNWADFPAPGTVGNVGTIPQTIPVASIVADTSGTLPASLGPSLLITTQEPHGLSTGVNTATYPPKGGFGTPSWTRNGQPWTGTYGLDISGGIGGIAVVVNATQYIVQLIANPLNDAAGSNIVYSGGIVAAGAYCTWNKTPGLPPADMAQMLKEIWAANSATVAHINIPACISDAALALLAQAYAAFPGRLRVEFCNEPWNIGVPVFGQCKVLGQLAGMAGSATDYVPFYMARSAQVWAAFHAVFDPLGRSADLIHVINCNGTDQGTVSRCCQYAVGNKIPVHEITIGHYANNDVPSATGGAPLAALQPLYATFTAGQHLDLLILSVESAQILTLVANTRASIASAGLARPDGTAITISGYEGGLQAVIAGAPLGATVGPASSFYPLYYEVARSPRMAGFVYRRNQLMQAAGMAAADDFNLAGSPPPDMWSKVDGYGQAIGTGSASDPALANQYVAGVDAWNAGLPAPTPPAPAPAPAPTPPGTTGGGYAYLGLADGSVLTIRVGQPPSA